MCRRSKVASLLHVCACLCLYLCLRSVAVHSLQIVSSVGYGHAPEHHVVCMTSPGDSMTLSKLSDYVPNAASLLARLCNLSTVSYLIRRIRKQTDPPPPLRKTRAKRAQLAWRGVRGRRSGEFCPRRYFGDSILRLCGLVEETYYAPIRQNMCIVRVFCRVGA